MTTAHQGTRELVSSQESGAGNRLLLFAAAMGWIGISIHLYNWLDIGSVGLTVPRSNLILGITSIGISTGIANICRYAQSGTLAAQWTLIGMQVVAGLTATYLAQIYTPAMMLIIGMAQVPARTGIPIISGFFAASNIALAVIFHRITPTFSQTVVDLLIFVGFQLFALTIAITQQRERLAKESLASANRKLVATRNLLSQSARSEERLRVSRELHDVVGHSLTAMTVRLEAHTRIAPEDLKPGLQATLGLARELLDNIRAVVSHLRQHDVTGLPDELDRMRGLYPDIHIHLQPVDRRVSQMIPLGTVVRCIQEAITNSVRHGQARNFWIVITANSSEIEIVTRDDGFGGSDFVPGNGLRGMEERLSGVGGRLNVYPSLEEGWTLKMFIPIS